MIILFNENEKTFANLGLGVLKEATKCVVKQSLNDAYTLELVYPITGKYISKLNNEKIIYCKPDPYSKMQAFRIYNVTTPIDGKVTISAAHISYDLNYIPTNAFKAESLDEALLKIQNECLISHDFKFISDVKTARTYEITGPANLRALLMGSEDSIVGKYDAELEFDNYVVNLLEKRGKNRGAVVRYGYNMQSIDHQISNDLLYNGVFPFYHTETEKTNTETSSEFTKAYIVGTTPFQDGWLSFEEGGSPYHPLDSEPVQIFTEGDYYNKVYSWDEQFHLYREKVYNQSVIIIQGIIEPTWITIDWSNFPNIICRAASKGYFKTMTDEDWGEIKGVGDIIFQGSILNPSGLMENLIIYFSEVIPSGSQSENSEVSEIVDVQLDDPIIWLDTADTKTMKNNKIFMLDLSSEFEEEPTQQQLKVKAEEYIAKNKLGTVKYTTTLSFLDLSSSNDGVKLENIDHIELGDTVKVVYEEANITVDLRVIEYEYDVIAKRYSSVTLGEKEDKFSSETVQTGDNVSSLSNDVGYADITTVNKLIATTVTANYIEALNAKLSSAQISQLEVERINVKGIFEASQFTLDNLVAKLLVTENAEITNTLTAGNIKVAGDISVLSGSINISSGNNETTFNVDRDGNVTANSVFITGGIFNINDGVFTVDENGTMTANDAAIVGSIVATNGNIGNLIISNGYLSNNDKYDLKTGFYLSGDIYDENNDLKDLTGLEEGQHWNIIGNSMSFGVTKEGKMYAKEATIHGNINITSGSINISDKFEVDSYGEVTAKSMNITGGSIEIKDEDGTIFKVDKYGKVTTNSIEINGGSITINDEDNKTKFEVDKTGKLTANNVYISGGIINVGDGNFIVDNGGAVTAKNISIQGGTINVTSSEHSSTASFNVYSDGTMTAKDAVIEGNISIKEGNICIGLPVGMEAFSEITDVDELFTARYLTKTNYEKNTYYVKNQNEYILSEEEFDEDENYYEFKKNQFYIQRFGDYQLDDYSYYDSDEKYYKNNANFYVDNKGNVVANSILINSGNISLGKTTIDNTGTITTVGANIIEGSLGLLRVGHFDTNKKFPFIGITNDGEEKYSFKPFETNSLYIMPAGSYNGYSYGDDWLGEKINTWGLTLGKYFGVTLLGEMYASKGNIAGFTIDKEKIIKGEIGSNNSVLVSIGTLDEQSTISIAGSPKGQTWTFTSGKNFGVTVDGNAYLSGGKIGGLSIDSTSLYYTDNFKISSIPLNNKIKGVSIGSNYYIDMSNIHIENICMFDTAYQYIDGKYRPYTPIHAEYYQINKNSIEKFTIDDPHIQGVSPTKTSVLYMSSKYFDKIIPIITDTELGHEYNFNCIIKKTVRLTQGEFVMDLDKINALCLNGQCISFNPLYANGYRKDRPNKNPLYTVTYERNKCTLVFDSVDDTNLYIIEIGVECNMRHET